MTCNLEHCSTTVYTLHPEDDVRGKWPQCEYDKWNLLWFVSVVKPHTPWTHWLSALSYLASAGRPVQLFIADAPLSEPLPLRGYETRLVNGLCHLKGHSILTVSCLITKPTQNLFTPLLWPPSPLIETCFCKSHSGLKSPHQRNWSENFYIRVKSCCRLYFPSSLPPSTMFFSKINLVSAQLHGL